MSKNQFTYIMFSKIQTLCNSIKNYFNINYIEALKLLYNSKLYKALEDEETKMWYYSNYDLFRMFLEERKTGNFNI